MKLFKRRMKMGDRIDCPGGGSMTILWTPPRWWNLIRKYRLRRSNRRFMKKLEASFWAHMSLKPDEFICAHCQGKFTKERPEQEALEELEANFPGTDQKDSAVICDDCYQQFINWAKDEDLVGKPVPKEVAP